MKKRLALLLVMSLLFALSACGDNEEKKIVDMFCGEVAEAESIRFTAALRAEYPDKTSEFELEYVQNQDGIRVTVLEPEIISGISAVVSDENARLEYDGAILDIGTLSANGLSPMSALPITMMAIKNAYVDSTWTEDDVTAAKLIPSDDTEIILRLNAEAIPCAAEIICDGKTVVFIEFDDWEMK